MAGLIFINGSPGTGKTTACKLLKTALDTPYIELSVLQEFHLNDDWSNQTPEKYRMSFENLVFILKNYLKYGFKNVIVTDLREEPTQQIPALFDAPDFLIFTLFVTDDELLKCRVLDETRGGGYRNYREAIAWNRRERERPLLPNEMRIDTTSTPPEEVVKTILAHL